MAKNDLAHDLERKLASHDRDITMIVNAIRNLITPPSQKKRQIGFDVEEEEDNQGCNTIQALLITLSYPQEIDIFACLIRRFKYLHEWRLANNIQRLTMPLHSDS
jgi:hypothetical protein